MALSERARAVLAREKALVLRALKDLEFDRSMGKVSQADFEEMAARLRTRALSLMKQLDEDGTGYRTIIERELSARLAARSAAGRLRRSNGGAGACAGSDRRGTLLVRHRERRRCALLQAVRREARERRRRAIPMSLPVIMPRAKLLLLILVSVMLVARPDVSDAQQMPDPKDDRRASRCRSATWRSAPSSFASSGARSPTTFPISKSSCSVPVRLER